MVQSYVCLCNFVSLFFLQLEGYLWPYWSRASRALYTPGTARRCRTRSEHNSPSMAILVSCIVPSLRSVCYKYTTTGNLWTGAEHTGSHSCSMLQIDGVSQGYWWFVWMHRETRMGRSVEHLHVEPLSTTSATRPNVTQGHQQVKQPATSGKKWKYGLFWITCARSVRRTEKVSPIQVPTSPKQLQSPTDHSPGMLLIGWVNCGLCKTVKRGFWLCVLRQCYWSSMDYIALTMRIHTTPHYKVNSFDGLSRSKSLCSFLCWCTEMLYAILCFCRFCLELVIPIIPRPIGMFCFGLFLLKSLCRSFVEDSASIWSFQFGGNFHSSSLMLPPDWPYGGGKRWQRCTLWLPGESASCRFSGFSLIKYIQGQLMLTDQFAPFPSCKKWRS